MKRYEVSVAVYSNETGMFLFQKFFQTVLIDDETIPEVLEDIKQAARRGRLFAMPRFICRDSGTGYYLHGLFRPKVIETVTDGGPSSKRIDGWVRIGPNEEFGKIQDDDAYDIVVNVIPASDVTKNRYF